MKIFSHLYNKVMVWCEHRHAPFFLAGISFAESSCAPVPPDVMLIPMTLANPDKVWRYATITTIASVCGGLLGYMLGYFFITLIRPYLEQFGYGPSYEHILIWFNNHGIWVMLLSGFAPVPYKVFTIGAGAVHMPLLPFMVACTLGRTARFFIVSALIYWGGERMERVLRRSIDTIGWVIVAIVLVMYLIWRFTHVHH